MNDLTLVTATLMDAVSALESRDTPLTPLEKVKLKALRLNLETALCATPVTFGTPAHFVQPQHGHIADPLEERFRTVYAVSVRIHTEARSLVHEVSLQIARARALTNELRSGLARSERNCAMLSEILRPN
jgi:hypothetical protein